MKFRAMAVRRFIALLLGERGDWWFNVLRNCKRTYNDPADQRTSSPLQPRYCDYVSLALRCTKTLAHFARARERSNPEYEILSGSIGRWIRSASSVLRREVRNFAKCDVAYRNEWPYDDRLM